MNMIIQLAQKRTGERNSNGSQPDRMGIPGIWTKLKSLEMDYVFCIQDLIAGGYVISWLNYFKEAFGMK